MSILSSSTGGIQKYLTDIFEERKMQSSTEKNKKYKFISENGKPVLVFDGQNNYSYIIIYGSDILCKYKCENQQNVTFGFFDVTDKKQIELIDNSLYKGHTYYFYNGKFDNEKFILKHHSHISYSTIFLSKSIYEKMKNNKKYEDFLTHNTNKFILN